MLSGLIASLGVALLYAGTSLLPGSFRDVQAEYGHSSTCVVEIVNNLDCDNNYFIVTHDGTPYELGYGESCTLTLDPYDSNSARTFTAVYSYSSYAYVTPLLSNSYVTDLAWVKSPGDRAIWYLPWFEGDMTISLTAHPYPVGVNGAAPTFAVDALDNIDKVYNGVHAHELYSLGYDKGYSVGYSNGFDSATTLDNGLYFQWDTSYNNNRTFTISWTIDGVAGGSQPLSYYNSTAYLDRPYDHVYGITISADNGTPFGIRYSSVSNSSFALVVSDYFTDGVCYLPFWEGSMTFTIVPDTSYGTMSSYPFALDNSSVAKVKIGYAYAFGYDSGYADGSKVVTTEAMQEGYKEGYLSGWRAGNEAGYAAGLREGGSAAGGVQVVDIWGMLSAVVSMPFTFFSQGLDWKLFEGSVYEFDVAAFFGTLLVGLMLWKIVSLIVGLWGGKA